MGSLFFENLSGEHAFLVHDGKDVYAIRPVGHVDLIVSNADRTFPNHFAIDVVNDGIAAFYF
jgi:hypothetical protein